MTKRLTMLICAFLMSFILFQAVASRLVWAASESVEPTFFWKSDDSPQDNDYVWFPCSHSKISSSATHCIKLLRCSSGQELATIGRNYWCDGEPLGVARRMDMDGNPLSAYRFKGVIPHGKAFVLGESHNSFDSRYFGLVETQHMIRLLPVF